MQSRYDFLLSLDIQGQLVGAKQSKSGKNRFQEGFLKTFARFLPGLLRLLRLPLTFECQFKYHGHPWHSVPEATLHFLVA